MQNPEISLIVALKDGWNLTGDLAAANIRFSTGWYEEDIDMPQISITELLAMDEPFELGYGTVRVNAVYDMNIWVKVLRDTNKGQGKAKEWLWDMRVEAKRIIKSKHKTLTDVALVLLDDVGRRLDEPDKSPSLFRWSQQIGVRYDI